ncbi:MAG: hypothetical protein L0Z54_04250 [Thermoplasmata archaeon]|nr:hypothetical protein [Thermoplasmata archaeon]
MHHLALAALLGLALMTIPPAMGAADVEIDVRGSIETDARAYGVDLDDDGPFDLGIAFWGSNRTLLVRTGHNVRNVSIDLDPLLEGLTGAEGGSAAYLGSRDGMTVVLFGTGTVNYTLRGVPGVRWATRDDIAWREWRQNGTILTFATEADGHEIGLVFHGPGDVPLIFIVTVVGVFIAGVALAVLVMKRTPMGWR